MLASLAPGAFTVRISKVGYTSREFAVQISAGQTVHKGDVIGYVGNTGDVRGANGGYHLHLELRINGTRTDPLQYIPH